MPSFITHCNVCPSVCPSVSEFFCFYFFLFSLFLFAPGSEAGLLLLSRSLLSGCLALHVTRLPGSQLCALPGSKVITVYHTLCWLFSALIWALSPFILLNTSHLSYINIFYPIHPSSGSMTGAVWMIGLNNMTEVHYYITGCPAGCFIVPVFSHQVKPLWVVQSSSMSARAQRHAGEPVHPWKQLVVPCWRLHAAGIRDNAQSLVDQMCQWCVVSYTAAKLCCGPASLTPLPLRNVFCIHCLFIWMFDLHFVERRVCLEGHIHLPKGKFSLCTSEKWV